jgi:hypothetical protein
VYCKLETSEEWPRAEDSRLCFDGKEKSTLPVYL